MEPAHILIVGVDIGVSASGISCCLLDPGATSNPQEPKLIRLRGGTNEEPPLDLEPTELGIGEAGYTYGRGITDDEDKFTLMKLSMLSPVELCDQHHPQGHEVIRLPLDKIARHPEIDAMAEYIKCLWDDGSSRVEDYLSDNQLQSHQVEARFIFGIPAVWKQDATNKMREAIKKSDILAFGCRLPAALDFVAEPVAAALAALPEVVRGERLKVNDKVLILDCGGGTVDSVAYKLKSLSPNHVEPEECVAPEWRFLGSIFMKSAFVTLAKQNVKAQMGDNPWLLDHAALDSNIDREWEILEKRIDSFWTEDPLLPTVEKIATFAEKQVQAAHQVARIVVVGGFGRNVLVQAELRRRFGNKVVFTYDEGEIAVKKGTCLRGIQLVQDENKQRLEIQPAQDGVKKAPSSFGYRLDESSPKIKWFMSKGDLISGSKRKPTLFPFPPIEAFTREPAPTLVIYRTSIPMGGLVDYPASDGKVKESRIIKCKNQELLRDGLPRELAVYIYGVSNIHFDAHLGGQPCPDDHFTISLPK
ncbi:hypothetical protein F5144DRAFT_661501 [Chaetomium tenue]|uniref:Uncharacterized protein n=1 Tax=Chaetomium tenue TaxID=1854479 RepID=A0ACB7NYX5_9PEZI|nr:hypothetical protein F5144DRAFT_661501 [Chaetomium globosum]